MIHYPRSLLNLVENLAKLPGIGTKTADRLAMHILRGPRREAESLARSIIEVKEKIRLCRRCFAFSDEDLCKICRSPGRDGQSICVVEQPADLASMEKSGAYSGMYHILQGALSPIDGVGPDEIRIRELMARLDQGSVTEVILATSTTVEGEATAAYIAQRLKGRSVRVTRIASGVPMGGDLKYVDQVTLKRAMQTRHSYEIG